ncbi:MAG: hypothetical protein EOO15_07380 [Chitinophagaceae bacterium]|nr:MAG: hypothetical protein EOO15_07380 [Chitinophagaceae bacterium]
MDNATLNPYRSPVRLLLHAGEPLQPFSPQTLARARKKLVAELALTGDELTIGEQVYTRHDINTLLQDISEEQWSMHCLVYTITPLLNFLETATADLPGMEKELRPFRFKPGFAKFMSSWFALSFRDATARMIRNVQPAELAELLLFRDFISPQDEELAYERLRRYFDELLTRIRGIEYDNFEANRTALNFLYSPAWIRFINALPPALAQERDLVAEALLSLVARFQNKATWAFLDQLCQRLLLINTNDELRIRLANAAHIVGQNARRSPVGSTRPGAHRPAKTSEGPSTGRIIFGVFWVIVMIVRLASTDSCRSRNSYSNISEQLRVMDDMTKPVRQQRSSKDNENQLLSILDSLSDHKQPKSTDRPDTGEPAFPGHSERPERYGEDNFVVRNATGKDMLFFWFSSDHLLLDSTDAPYAVFIRKGDSISFPMRNGRDSRFAAAFGDGWARLPKAALVPLRSFQDVMISRMDSGRHEATGGTLPIRSYFRKPMTKQPFLDHLIRLSYYSSRDIDDEKLYEPADPGAVHEEGSIRFVEENGTVKAIGGGTYYLNKVAIRD